MNESRHIQQAILFADISGSTALYDKLGDQQARRMVAACLNLMAEVTMQHQGRVIKTIGDELMCCFDSAEQALLAACAMQQAVENQLQDPSTPIHIRIGFHYGPVLLEDGDVHGDTVNVAARLTTITRARQILTSRMVAESLPPSLGNSVRKFMRREFRGKGEATDVYQVIWEKEDTTSTRIGMSAYRKPKESRNELMLRYKKQVLTLNEPSGSVMLGRNENCDIVVGNTLASRQHAHIERRFNKLFLVDHSANGTFVRFSDGQVISLVQEELTLHGSGHISLGTPFAEEPEDLIEFLIQ